MSRKGQVLRAVLQWPLRLSFTTRDLRDFMQELTGRNTTMHGATYHLKSWLKKGFIRRITTGIYTTELGNKNVIGRMVEDEVKDFLLTLPSRFTVYQFKLAYNKHRGDHLFDRAILTRWKAKGFISKDEGTGRYINNIRMSADENSNL